MSTYHTSASHPVARGDSASSSHQIVRYGDSGVGTVEGAVAGSRAVALTTARNAEKASYEAQKSQIEAEQRADKVVKVDDKFVSYSDAYEAEFKKRTVGLVTAAEFRERRAGCDKLEEKARTHDPVAAAKARLAKKNKKKRAKDASLLSFAADFDEEEEGEGEDVGRPGGFGGGFGKLGAAEAGGGSGDGGGGGGGKMAASVLPPPAKKCKSGGASRKDPTVDTSFLPDRQREAEEARRREELRQEWRAQQARVQAEMIEVTYSYWDGSGHRRNIDVPKGTTVGKYLELVRQDLAKEFAEMRGVSSDNLLYIKEDLIIPHHFSFYDLIVTKARGKSGPLFCFDVHDDVRLTNDARVEKDESHPGKIVERAWYERNKHIFPASRWEVYDPAVKRDKYTIHGGEIQ
jgi:protein FAM50